MAVEEEKDAGEISREISREMVSLLKRYVGRGPTYARTFLHRELVTVIFHDTMTTAEETLKAQGEEGQVRELRHTFQGAFRDEAVSIVERAVGRPVSSFLSDHDVEHDWAIEAFVIDGGGAPDV